MTRPASRGSLLLVGNYQPDVGFAWWLMESFWVELAALMRSRGLDPLLVYPRSGTVPESIRQAEIEVLTQAFPGRGLGALWRSWSLVRRHRVKMVYFTDRNATRLSNAVLRLAGVKLIVVHDHTPGDRPPVRGLKGTLKALWRRLPLINTDLTVCVSPLIQERAVQNHRLPRSRTAVVQNGIHPIDCSGDATYTHQVLDIPPEATICMTVARANRYKRIDFVIEVARRVVFERGRQDVVFVFCGDGPDLERFQQLAAVAKLDRHFVFAGRRTDVPALLCGADIALHPSQGEAFSLAIVEYMSAGLALIVPDIPTVAQAVRHEQTGLVYPDGDAETVANMVCDLASDETRRRGIGARAADAVRTSYSFTGMHAQFRNVMEQAADRAGLSPLHVVVARPDPAS